jgi:drug/metabolite transporter (DMT)-like permease
VTLTPNLRGALWMLASALGFTAMTTLIKYLGPGYPAALQTFYRQLAGVVVLLPLIARDWRAAFRTTRPGILIFRSSAGVLALIMGFYAYQKLPLADANALSFTRTLWLVRWPGWFCASRSGPCGSARRWSALSAS